MKRARAMRACCALAFCAALWGRAEAQNEADRPDDDKRETRELRYFRVEVPLDHEEEWEKLYFGFQPHPYPIEQAEFDRLLETIRSAPTRTSAAAVRIASLSGDAVLEGDALIGAAVLDVVATTPDKSLLSLAGGNFAITSAKWADGRAAEVGAAPDGTPVVVVERSARLHIQWSLRGSRDADETLRFDLRLPSSQTARFDLRLPRPMEIAATRGVLAEQPSTAEEQRRWTLELGSLPATQLIVGGRRPARSGQNQWLVEQRSDYVIGDEGLRVTTECAIQRIADSPLTGVLHLFADDGLQLTSAAIDGTPVEWEISQADGAKKILLDLGSAGTALPATAVRKILLTAIGEFPPGAARTLPAIRPLAVVWQAGRANVTVGKRWQIGALDVTGGRLAGLAESPEGRMAKVEFFDPNGRITLACEVPSPRLEARSTYIWRFSPDNVEARLLAELTANRGTVYEVKIPLAPGWEIDAQDVRIFAASDSAEAASVLADSRVAIAAKQVQIHFDSPLTPERPLRLEITARRQHNVAERSLSMDELLFARLPSPADVLPIGVATTASPYRVRLSGATASVRVPREAIPSGALAWIPASAAYTPFYVDRATSRPTVEIVRDPPRIEVDVEMTVDVDREQIAEQHDIHVRPDGTGVDRLRVSFWPPRGEPPAWTMTTVEELPVVEFRRVAAGALASESPGVADTLDAAEVWEAQFHERQTAPFTLHALRAASVAAAGPTRVTFAAVDEATTQTGRVVVRSPASVPLDISARRLRSVAAPAEKSDGALVRGAYRYEPARVMPAGDSWLDLAPTARVGRAWAWRLTLDSRFTTGAVHGHRATWLVQNEGLPALGLRLPQGGTLQNAAVAGRAVDVQDDGHGRLLVPLPRDAALVEVRVDYSTASKPWGVSHSIAPLSAELDIPVLRSEWHVALPAGYVASYAAHDGGEDAKQPVGQRLFGSWYQHAPRSFAWSTANGDLPELTQLSVAAQRQVAALAERLGQPNTTWGQALVDVQLAPLDGQQQPPTLLVDALAVASAGVQQNMLVNFGRDAPTRSLAAILTRANLALLAADDVLVLTSADAARVYRDSSSAAPEPLVRIAGRAAAESFVDPRFRAPELVTPQIWASPHAPARGPGAALLASSIASEALGGNTISMMLPASGEATIRVYRGDLLAALRWSMLLAALGAAWWAKAWGMPSLLALGALAGCVALWASPPVSLVASGIFLGLLLGAAWRMLWRADRPLRPAPLIGETSTATAVTQLALLLLLGLGLATTLPSAMAAETKSARPYPVWIPVNDKREPSGEVYLPKAFYGELQARARAVAEAPRGWLLLGAAYDLRLGWRGNPASLQAEELRIVYDIGILEPVPLVSLPLPRMGAVSDDAWATLDGEPIKLAWREGHSALDVPIHRPGRYRLELRVQPLVDQQQGAAQLDLAIPPAATAKLQVTAPLSAPAVRVGRSQGAVEQSEAILPLPDGGEERVARWQAAIGGVDRLQVNWPQRVVASSPGAEFTVEQLGWLDLANGPRFVSKFRCHVKSGTLRDLVLLAPKELKLLPSTAKWEAVASSVASLSAYRLALEKLADQEVVVRAEFQLPARPAPGRMVLPLVQLAGEPAVTKSSLALTLPVELDLVHEAAQRPAGVDEFLRRWGEAASVPPDHVFQLEPAAAPLQLLFRPVNVLPASRESLQVGLAIGQARVELQAEVEPASPPRQTYTLTLPPGFSVQHVEVAPSASESDERLLAWWSVDADKLRLFLHEPATQKHRIVVAGVVDTPRGKSQLPMVRLNEAVCAARTVDLLRHEGVLAEIVDSPGFAVAHAASPTVPGAAGRSLAKLTDQSPATTAAACTLQISENRPRIGGRQITQLLRENETWVAQVDLHLEVADGLVDALRVQLPTSLASQITLQPPLTHRVAAGPDGSGRELVIYPDTAISGSFHVSLRADYAAPQGQNVQVPDIRLRDVPGLLRCVVVPREIEGQKIEWRVDRMLALSPQRREELGLADGETIAYRVVSDPFHAELRALRRLAGVPLVRLADVRFAWEGQTSCSGWATFDLEPAGLSYCTVAVPHNYRLVFVRTGEVAAQVQPISAQRWRVALRPQGMPQRMEVFYHGELTPASEHPLQAAAPVLEDVAVERTLWTVYGPVWAGRGAPQTGGEASPWRQDLVRLRSLTEIMRLPRHVRVETTGRETSDWWAPWESRWQAVRGDVVRAQLQSPEDQASKAALAELQAIDDDHQQILQDLDLAAPAPTTAKITLPEFWRYTVSRTDIATRAVVQGSSATMVVEFPRAASASPARWILGALLAVVAVALLFARHWLPPGDWPLRSGRAIGVLVGIAWALWLWPAWVGWAIVVLLLLPDDWPRWKRPPSETGSAIVIRSASAPR